MQTEQPLLIDENQYSVIIGCDEAGRGPLAGPVYASSVVLPFDFPFEILNDSKKLSASKREKAEQLIKKLSVAWAVSWATPAEIDKINILQASLLAMKRSYICVRKQLDEKKIVPEILLVDGNKTPDVEIACEAVVKGDASVHEIMAASILAKTARDAFMKCAAKRWPVYGFERHMGYPTPEHRHAIEKYGPCPIHRMTFTLLKNQA